MTVYSRPDRLQPEAGASTGRADNHGTLRILASSAVRL